MDGSLPDGGAGDGGVFPQIDLYPSAGKRLKGLVLHTALLVIFSFLTWASFSSNDRHNQIYILTGALAFWPLFRLVSELRKMHSRKPDVSVNASGLHIFHPTTLHWPWSRIKGAHSAGGSVIVELHEFAGIDQGVWNRADVTLPMSALDGDEAELLSAIQNGVQNFAGE